MAATELITQLIRYKREKAAKSLDDEDDLAKERSADLNLWRRGGE